MICLYWICLQIQGTPPKKSSRHVFKPRDDWAVRCWMLRGHGSPWDKNHWQIMPSCLACRFLLFVFGSIKILHICIYIIYIYLWYCLCIYIYSLWILYQTAFVEIPFVSLPVNFLIPFGFEMMYLRKMSDVRPSITLCGFSILKQKTH